MSILLRIVLAIGLTWMALMGARAGELTIAAASDLQFALDELTAEFRTNHPAVKVKITYGSSGNFYAQLQNKAPFDLYFSADVEYPRQLAQAGLAMESNVFLYAVGRLVVWAPTNSPLDVEKLGLQALLAPSVKKIAIANPDHAPYGRAAVAAMKSWKVYEQAAPRLVLGENIAQTAQFVQSGAAEVGVIALSLAIAPQLRKAGRHGEVPIQAYPKMEQGGMITKWTKDAASAKLFRDFVLGDHGRDVLQRYGFFLPKK